MPKKASDHVRTIRFPRLLIYLLIAVFIYPFFQWHESQIEVEQLTQKESETAQVLAATKVENQQLTDELVVLYDEREAVLSYQEALHELNEELTESVTKLPEEALGGIEIEVELTHLNSQASLNDHLSDGSWLSKYQQTIQALEKLETNLNHLPTYFPTEATRISSHFGLRSDPFTKRTSIHSGIDFAGPVGSLIFAGADGVVTRASRWGGYGKTIVIKHNDTYETLYAHLSSIDVEVGDRVYKGDAIGKLGNTGRSTGPHLHYEVIKNGEPVDPYHYITLFEKEGVTE